MSCPNIMRILALSRLRLFKCHQIPLHVRYALRSYSVFSRLKLQYYTKVNDSKYFPSSNFRTSIKRWNGESDSDGDKMDNLSESPVQLTFVTHDGNEIFIEGKVGSTVMQAATKVQGKIPMEAACDGQLACTTCHVYVDEKSKPYFEESSNVEDDLLDSAPFCRPNSRLSCQLKISPEMQRSGARFYLPCGTSNFNVDKDKKR